MIDVRVYSSASTKIVELRDAFLATMHSGVQLLRLLHYWGPLVVIKAQDVVFHAISVIQGHMGRFRVSRSPEVGASHVLFVLGRGDHCIVHVLEGLCDSRWLAADVISWVPWEGLSLEADLVSLKGRRVIESQFESMLGAPEGNLTSRNSHMIICLGQAKPVSPVIEVPNRVLPDKVSIVVNWVNSSALYTGIGEATIRSDRFRLGSCC